jgi:hypothetical protein
MRSVSSVAIATMWRPSAGIVAPPHWGASIRVHICRTGDPLRQSHYSDTAQRCRLAIPLLAVGMIHQLGVPCHVVPDLKTALPLLTAAAAMGLLVAAVQTAIATVMLAKGRATSETSAAIAFLKTVCDSGEDNGATSALALTLMGGIPKDEAAAVPLLQAAAQRHGPCAIQLGGLYMEGHSAVGGVVDLERAAQLFRVAVECCYLGRQRHDAAQSLAEAEKRIAARSSKVEVAAGASDEEGAAGSVSAAPNSSRRIISRETCSHQS